MVRYLILLVIGAAVITGVSLLIINKAPKFKTLLNVALLVIAAILGYLLVESIMEPIRFNKEVKKRYDATVEKLKDIRMVQESYKDKYGKYTGSFDTLIMFVETDSFEIPRYDVVGEWDQDEMTKEQALKAGILRELKFYIPVGDSLFEDKSKVKDLRYIPFSDGVEFTMGAGEVETGSKVVVEVFEAYAKFDELFVGLERQLVINYKDEKEKIMGFDGIKVGSLEEANNNAGNWEK